MIGLPTTGSAVFDAAFLRSAMQALLMGGVTCLTAWQQGQTWPQSFAAGGILVLTTIIARGGLEGAYDANRSRTGNMNAGDVPVASDKVDVTKVIPPAQPGPEVSTANP